MKYKKFIFMLLCLLLFPALEGCQKNSAEKEIKSTDSRHKVISPLPKQNDRGSGVNEDKDNGTDSSTVHSTDSSTDSSAEASEKIPSCAGTWKYIGWTAEGQELRFRLLLGKNGEAQLQKTDDQDMVLSVSVGLWSASDDEQVTLHLTLWMENGLEVPEANRTELSGIYGTSFGYSDSMTLSCTENASPLVPNHEYEPATFYNENPSPVAMNGAPRGLIETWVYTNYTEDGIRVNRLTLMEDGYADLPIQNEIGELLGLCFGTWSVDGDILSLSLTEDPAIGTMFSPEWEDIGGDYRYELWEDGMLSLTDLDNPHPILPNMPGETVFFESSAAQFQRIELEVSVCDAVLAYYEAKNGAEYPGYADVEGRDENGNMIVHLYEDMGDHIATSAWYTINSETFQGTDDVMFQEIDFSPYRD